MHYGRWRTYGDPLTVLRRVRPTDIPFPVWFRAQFVENGGCLDWMHATNRMGYGVVGRGGKTVLTHRAAWELVHGPIPEGLHILHRCDRPICGNVQHLFLGTHLDNMQDMAAKSRVRSNLTEADVRAIREMRARGVARPRVASLFGIDLSTVSRITGGKTRRQIPDGIQRP